MVYTPTSAHYYYYIPLLQFVCNHIAKPLDINDYHYLQPLLIINSCLIYDDECHYQNCFLLHNTKYNGRISCGYAEIKLWLNHPEKWVLISNEGIKQTDETNCSNNINGICHLTVLMELMYTQPPTNETGYSLVIKHGWMGPYQWRVLWKKSSNQTDDFPTGPTNHVWLLGDNGGIMEFITIRVMDLHRLLIDIGVIIQIQGGVKLFG